jgi:hypothetical protein
VHAAGGRWRAASHIRQHGHKLQVLPAQAHPTLRLKVGTCEWVGDCRGPRQGAGATCTSIETPTGTACQHVPNTCHEPPEYNPCTDHL